MGSRVHTAPRNAAVIVAASAVLAVLLECGTLAGAPLSSPLNGADWNLLRLGFFLLLSLPSVSFAVLFDWRAWWERRRARRRNAGRGWRFWVEQAPERIVALLIAGAGTALALGAPWYTHISWDDHIHYDRAVAASYVVNPEYTAADAALIVRAYNDIADYARASSDDAGWKNPFDDERLQAIYDELNALQARAYQDGAQAADADDVLPELSDASAMARDGEGYPLEVREDARAAGILQGLPRDTSTVDVGAFAEADAVRMDGAVTLRGVPIVEYYLVAYIPAAVALWLARLLTLPATTAFVLGRLATLLCYTLVVYCACRRLKSGKMILAAVAMVPTAVFLASGYSYDFWLIAFLMLGFSYFLGELQRPDEPLTWRNTAIMVGAFLVGLGPKAVYVPIAAMLLFMPKAKFASSRRRLAGERSASGEEQPASAGATMPGRLAYGGVPTHGAYLAVIFASAAFVLATFVLPFFVAGPGEGDARGGAVDPAMQIAFITQQPLAYAGVFFDFLRQYLSLGNSEFVLTDFCGIETAREFLGVDGTQVMRMIAVFLPMVALFDRGPCDAVYATHAKRLAMLGLALLTLFLAATALYISFTPGGAHTIEGMQGRYLLPLLFPVFAFCLNFKTLGRVVEGGNRLVFNGGVLLLSAAFLYGSVFEVLLARL